MSFFYKFNSLKIIRNIIIGGLILSTVPIPVFAFSKKTAETLSLQKNRENEKNEKEYLIQVYNALTALQPLILKAKLNQVPNTPVKFHYTKFVDNEGKVHSGLLDDVQAMRQGIIAGLEPISIEPRVISPVNGDYINNFKKIRKTGKTGKISKT